MAPDILRLPRQAIGRSALEGIDRAVASRWDRAIQRADETSGPSRDERLEEVRLELRRELTALGAVSGGIAAVPGAGTGTALVTVGADIGWYTMRLADLILTMAVIHGHDEATVQERRAWVLSVLAFGGGATAGFTEATRQVRGGLGQRQLGSVSAATLRSLNRRLTTSLLRRYGARRGAVVLGSLMPFGVGAAIGAGGNAYSVDAAARHADRFFVALAAT